MSSPNNLIGKRVKVNNRCFLREHHGKTGEVVDYINVLAVVVKLDTGSNRPDGTITVFETSLELES